jgi:hypothetical protein
MVTSLSIRDEVPVPRRAREGQAADRWHHQCITTFQLTSIISFFSGEQEMSLEFVDCIKIGVAAPSSRS